MMQVVHSLPLSLTEIQCAGSLNNLSSVLFYLRLVKVAIRNTLEAAEKYNVVSIALPALSCGIFGVSKDLVARSMINAIRGFSFSKPTPILSDIRIVIIDEPTHSHFARYFQQSIQSSKGGSKKNTPPDHTSTASKPSRENAPLEAGNITCLLKIQY